jgi:hypothetical protein
LPRVFGGEVAVAEAAEEIEEEEELGGGEEEGCVGYVEI